MREARFKEIKAYRENGYSQEKTAHLMGVSRSVVMRVYWLLAMEPRIQKAWIGGLITDADIVKLHAAKNWEQRASIFNNLVRTEPTHGSLVRPRGEIEVMIDSSISEDARNALRWVLGQRETVN